LWMVSCKLLLPDIVLSVPLLPLPPQLFTSYPRHNIAFYVCFILHLIQTCDEHISLLI
jgi:hypothetical protein